MASRIAAQTLIGRNEEPFLLYALYSVQWVDYFTVVNTDPTSYWGEINKGIVHDVAKELGIPLRYCDYEPDEDGYFSFADARNQSLLMADGDDYIFIVDSDDVHYPEWENLVRQYIKEGADSITAHYYHLTLFKNVFHFSAPREIIYKNYDGTKWIKGVHEQLINDKHWPVNSTYHYIHYGYIKPQTQVFERWKFYSDLEGDFNHYDGQDPSNIISDRLAVCKPLSVEHPPVIQTFLESYPECPRETLKENWETVPAEKVGLVLLTYNDEENLKICLQTLVNTVPFPKFEVLAIDLGSEDASVTLLDHYKSSIDMQTYEINELISLTESLNFGFNHFRQRHDIQYIGWIHPDHTFEDPAWLNILWQELQEHPKIGKICAANTRVYIDESRPAVPQIKELTPGHEQCFIIRKDIVNKVGLYDEKYIGIGGYEDWDYNKRILNHDVYKIMISPRAKVLHTAMETRRRRDTSKEQTHNAQYYFEKWGTNEAPC